MTNITLPLLLLWLSHFFVDVMIGFWPVYKTWASLDLAVTGVATGLCVIVGEGMQFLFGTLGDRGWRRFFLVTGMIAAMSNAFLPFAGGQLTLIFSLLILTFLGSAAFHPSAVAMIATFAQKRRGFYITLFVSGGSLGMALSQILFNTFDHLTQGHSFILSIPLLFLSLAMVLLSLPGFTLPSSPTSRFNLSTFKKLFYCKDLKALYLTQVCNQAIVWGLIFLLPDILVGRGYEEWICFGGGHMFFILGSALMTTIGASLSDSESIKKILYASNVIAMALFYLFLGFPGVSSPLLLLTLFLLGASLGLSSPIALSLGNRMLPSQPGLVTALLMGFVWCVAEVLGPGGGGLLTKLFMTQAPDKALAIIGVFFITGMYTISLLPYKVTQNYELEYV